jgi:YbgC/YbaW family acyl-CoA thioester hydrolase
MSHGNESYVVKSINLLYHQPAELEDDLTVTTEIELITKARTKFFQSVLNSKNDTLICRGEVEVCFINNDSGKPKAFPLSFLNLLKN